MRHRVCATAVLERSCLGEVIVADDILSYIWTWWRFVHFLELELPRYFFVASIVHGVLLVKVYSQIKRPCKMLSHVHVKIKCLHADDERGCCSEVREWRV